MQKKTLVVSPRGVISSTGFKHMTPLKSLSHRTGPTGQIAIFLLEVGALEAVRRLSRARCPFIWKALQAFQVLCYPPFKWFHRWTPFKIMVDNFQRISKPLLFLSIATAFSDHHSENIKSSPNNVDDSQPNSELSRRNSTSDLRFLEHKSAVLQFLWQPALDFTTNLSPQAHSSSFIGSSEECTNEDSKNMMLQLTEELNKQHIVLPTRFNEDELQRFYEAAHGDFSCFVSSIKRTIRWRETYHIFSLRELEPFSHLVFWHGFDVMLRPCLVIRLGLAMSSLVPHDRPRFAQAVVSQIEHGILHLLNDEDPRITVVMDCRGISPFRFPMHMMRSCCNNVQVHYPNRLAALFVIRLPSVVRVLAQTLIQVLKPTTRRKLRIEGESYQNALSEFLQTVPAFLGGRCTCLQCERFCATKSLTRVEESSSKRQSRDCLDDDSAAHDYPIHEFEQSGDYNHVLRATILAFLMLWIVIAFFAGMHDLGLESV